MLGLKSVSRLFVARFGCERFRGSLLVLSKTHLSSVNLETPIKFAEMSNKRLIIDCDVGLDDAQAVILALGRSDVTVDGITAVRGNADVTNVAKNIRKVLKVCNRLDIPTYKGCSEPLIVDDRKEFTAYHGLDGLGDVKENDVISDDVIQSQHAVNFMIEAAAKEPKTLTLVCLGPLTNIATALKIDPNFGGNLKACHIMGGNYHAKGNITTTAEFNFHFDPEAAYIVLRSLKCPITITGWEACVDHPIPWADCDRLYSGNGPLRTFIRRREAQGIEWMKEHFHDYVFADQLAMAVAVDTSVVKESFMAKASVELHGHMTRGQMVVDRQAKETNVEIVVKLDMAKVIDMMIQGMDKVDQC